MGVPHKGNMAFVPYARGYGYPYAGYTYGYGPYGPSLEEVKKVREAEEKAFKEAEDRAKELMEAEKKQYEEFCEAQKKAVDDAVAKEKERELAIKLGTAPFAYGYPGYGYGGYGGYGHPAHRAGYGYPYGGYGYGRFY